MPVVHKWVPKQFARFPIGSKPEHSVPPPFGDRRCTPRHHPTRLRRLVELAIPHDVRRSIYHVLARLLCRVGNIRSAHVVPKRAEQTDKVLLRPLMPRPFPKRAHEKHILHPAFILRCCCCCCGRCYRYCDFICCQLLLRTWHSFFVNLIFPHCHKAGCGLFAFGSENDDFCGPLLYFSPAVIALRNLVSFGQPFFWDIKVAGTGYDIKMTLRARLTVVAQHCVNTQHKVA